MTNSSYFSNPPGAIHPNHQICPTSKQLQYSAARNWINSFPQTAATTFAFSSVLILLLWLSRFSSKKFHYAKIFNLTFPFLFSHSYPTLPLTPPSLFPHSSASSSPHFPHSSPSSPNAPSTLQCRVCMPPTYCISPPSLHIIFYVNAMTIFLKTSATLCENWKSKFHFLQTV